MEGASSMAQPIHANDDETRHLPDDAIALLTADHRQVRALFQQYADTPDLYLKQIIAEHVFAELTLHMLLEETVLYPAFAEQAGEEGKQLVDEALQDHQEIKALIETLQEIDNDAAFEASFQALQAQVEQHVEDEETRMFPEATQVLATHWEEITDLLRELKEHILAS
jgi:iron-sulfur cluster repair protein YtfE (RIC family)